MMVAMAPQRNQKSTAGAITLLIAGFWSSGIFGMLGQKEPEAIIHKIGGYFDFVSTVSIQNSSNTYSAIDLSGFFNQKGVPSKPVDSIKDGIKEIVRASNIPSRIIIMGSLSLVGVILEEHG